METIPEDSNEPLMDRPRLSRVGENASVTYDLMGNGATQSASQPNKPDNIIDTLDYVIIGVIAVLIIALIVLNLIFTMPNTLYVNALIGIVLISMFLTLFFRGRNKCEVCKKSSSITTNRTFNR